MKISIWIDERQLENLSKVINKESEQGVMFEKSEGFYPCDTQVILDFDTYTELKISLIGL